MAGHDITDMKQTLLIFLALPEYEADVLRGKMFQQDVQQMRVHCVTPNTLMKLRITGKFIVVPRRI